MRYSHQLFVAATAVMFGIINTTSISAPAKNPWLKQDKAVKGKAISNACPSNGKGYCLIINNKIPNSTFSTAQSTNEVNTAFQVPPIMKAGVNIPTLINSTYGTSSFGNYTYSTEPLNGTALSTKVCQITNPLSTKYTGQVVELVFSNEGCTIKPPVKAGQTCQAGEQFDPSSMACLKFTAPDGQTIYQNAAGLEAGSAYTGPQTISMYAPDAKTPMAQYVTSIQLNGKQATTFQDDTCHQAVNLDASTPSKEGMYTLSLSVDPSKPQGVACDTTTPTAKN